MKKRIIFILLILLVTGCTADYEVTVREDLSAKEELRVYESRNYFESKSNTVSEIINMHTNAFSDILVGSEVSDYRKAENAGKYIKTEYQNICDESKILNAANVFSKVECNFVGEFVILKFVDLTDLKGESDTLANVADINNVTYIIPFKVVEAKNFECAVKDGKTKCTARIEKNEKVGKDYEIKFSRISLPVEENVISENKENKTGLMILIFAIVAVLVGGIIFIYKKIKQNKTEY